MDRKKKVHRIPGIAFISPLNVVRRLVISFTSLNAFMILRERTVFKTLKDRKTLKTRKIAKYDNDEIKETTTIIKSDIFHRFTWKYAFPFSSFLFSPKNLGYKQSP